MVSMQASDGEFFRKKTSTTQVSSPVNVRADLSMLKNMTNCKIIWVCKRLNKC